MRRKLEFSSAELASLLRVSVADIFAAVDEGAPGLITPSVRSDASQFKLPKFLPWWVERERQRAIATPEVRTMSEG